jgi:hypothetical protein
VAVLERADDLLEDDVAPGPPPQLDRLEDGHGDLLCELSFTGVCLW